MATDANLTVAATATGNVRGVNTAALRQQAAMVAELQRRHAGGNTSNRRKEEDTLETAAPPPRLESESWWDWMCRIARETGELISSYVMPNTDDQRT